MLIASHQSELSENTLTQLTHCVASERQCRERCTNSIRPRSSIFIVLFFECNSRGWGSGLQKLMRFSFTSSTLHGARGTGTFVNREPNGEEALQSEYGDRKTSKILPWMRSVASAWSVVTNVRKLRQKQNYSTQYSQVVPHPSTNCANTSLTSEIRRDPVYSDVYGRSRSWKWRV